MGLLFGVPRVDSACFTAIQQCSENHRLVDLNLCLCFDAFSVPHVLVQSAESNARLGQSSVYLVIDHTVSGESATEVHELVHYLTTFSRWLLMVMFGSTYGLPGAR